MYFVYLYENRTMKLFQEEKSGMRENDEGDEFNTL
jgi:hypothetical protein